MRFCVSCRQPLAIRERADELYVEFKDIEFIEDYIEKYKEIKHYFTLNIGKEDQPNWQLLSAYNDKLNGQLLIELDNLNSINIIKEYGLKFCWSYPATNFYELAQMQNLGAEVIFISGSLIFQKDKLDTIKDLKIRLMPNYAMNIFPEDTGVCGSWVRPENLTDWENLIETCVFKYDTLTEEKTIFEIYKENVWENDLKLIVKGLNVPFYNQYMGTSLGKRRLTCEQKCMINQSECNMCNRIRKAGYVIRDSVLKRLTQTEQTENN